MADARPTLPPNIRSQKIQKPVQYLRDSADWARRSRKAAEETDKPLKEKDISRWQEIVESGGNLVVEVTAREHYKPSVKELAMDAMPTKIEMPVGD